MLKTETFEKHVCLQTHKQPEISCESNVNIKEREGGIRISSSDMNNRKE